MMNQEELIQTARKVRENAYVPYSKFSVGACVQTKSGNIYTGCNIENASFPLTCCAERVAIFKAVSAGDTAFCDMAVIAGTDEVVSPCGACRQVMNEFFDETVQIHLTNTSNQVKTISIDQLLPFSFQGRDFHKET